MSDYFVQLKEPLSVTLCLPSTLPLSLNQMSIAGAVILSYLVLVIKTLLILKAKLSLVFINSDLLQKWNDWATNIIT
jgi:hypothetical protein